MSAHPVEHSTSPPEWTLGDRIRKARDVLGIDQTQLGELLGVSGQAVSRWETGENGPSDVVATARAIERVARDRDEPGITAAWLLGLGGGETSLRYAPMLPFRTVVAA